ncbi:hypothetical protein ACN47E_000676 [Coniothyrium glycines]
MAVTNNVFRLRPVAYPPHQMPASSRELHKRRTGLWSDDEIDVSARRLALAKRQQAAGEEDLITLGGRVYMTDVTLAGEGFRLVIDTGSSDTWVTSAAFRCLNPRTFATIAQAKCGFNASYDPNASQSWQSIPRISFSVNYTGGEFLKGEMGTELLGIGEVSRGGDPILVANQTIGVVEEGYWEGDGISSGLMGLAYPALVSQAKKLKYDSAIFTLTNAYNIPKMFSLALDRPTPEDPNGGGILAIGGLPSVPYDGTFVTVPIIPVLSTPSPVYAWYSINVSHIALLPPSTSSSPRHTKPFLLPSPKNQGTYIIDSGSSLIYLPDTIADRIANSFIPKARFNPQSQMYIVKCNARAPQMGVVVGGTTFWVNEEDLMNKGIDAVGGPGLGAGEGECVLAVQRGAGGSLVLGDAWLKGVVVVFDLENDCVAVAGRGIY